MEKLNYAELITLGTFLKRLRKNKNKTTRDLSKAISYSQGHISGIENGKRGKPNDEFIEAVINELSDGYAEYNHNIDVLKKITKNKVDLTKNKIETDSMVEVFTESKKSANILHLENELGLMSYEVFTFPINDLHHLLKDNKNPKYYRTIELNEDDRRHIDNYLNNYLINKVDIQLTQIENTFKSNEISEKYYESMKKQLTDLKNDLNDPYALKYENL